MYQDELICSNDSYTVTKIETSCEGYIITLVETWTWKPQEGWTLIETSSSVVYDPSIATCDLGELG